MKVILILFLILAAMWFCYRDPVRFVVAHQSTGVLLVTAAVVAAIGGPMLIENMANPGVYLILYSLVMVIAFAITVGQLFYHTKGSRIHSEKD